MAVFIPEGSLIGQGTVGDSNVIVMVIGREWTTVMVGHRVTYSDTHKIGPGELLVCEQQSTYRLCLCSTCAEKYSLLP